MTLDVSQSTVSRRIKLLEHRIGFEIFRRDRKGAHLTPAGDNFLKEAAPGMSQLHRAIQLASARHRGAHGELNIGIFASLASGFLNLALKEFREQNPSVKVTLHEGTAQENLHRLTLGQLDVVFITGEPMLPGHISERLWIEHVYVVVPASHELADSEKLSWQEVRDETFIVSSGGPGPEIQDYLVKKLAGLGFRPMIEVHDVSRESLMHLVAIGYGLTLTSSSGTGTSTQGVVFRAIAEEDEELPSSVIWSPNNANPSLKHLLDLAKRLARDFASRAPSTAICILIALTTPSEFMDADYPAEPSRIHGRFL